VSVHFGNSSAAAHRATAAREEDRQARAERVEAEGWDEDGCCPTCGGSGEICFCVDDMCRALGECMHGDGDGPCPDCSPQRKPPHYEGHPFCQCAECRGKRTQRSLR